MARGQIRGAAFAAALLSGCTLISGASDYGISPSEYVRDLDYTFKDMQDAHAGSAINIAVVDKREVIQARAVVSVPKQPAGTDVPIVMEDALLPGPFKLFIFVDENGNGKPNRGGEHAYIEDVPADGVGTFVHSTMFEFFEADAYDSVGSDLVLKLPLPAKGQPSCLDEVGKRVEVKLFFVADGRQVGLFRHDRGTDQLLNEFRLAQVLDAGSQYRIEVLVDGVVKRSAERPAPFRDNWTLAARAWLPARSSCDLRAGD